MPLMWLLAVVGTAVAEVLTKLLVHWLTTH